MKVTVNRIIPFSSVDGVGNRTAIFLQGCNIDCKYCHNPETRGLCVSCGTCVKSCPARALATSEDGKTLFFSEKCVECDTCIKVCPNSSSPRTREMTADEVYAEVKKQIPFIRGITVSGGECMLYPEFLLKLFILAKKDGLGTLIDSNGTISFREYPDLLEVTDGVMLDIKAFDEEAHRRITGSSNKNVLNNAAYLAKLGKLEEVRIVVVQELYEVRKSVAGIADFLADYRKKKEIRIKLIAYRPMGVREEYSHYRIPSGALMEELADILRGRGLNQIVII